MGPEINIDSILALERQTKEGTGDVIHLKRFRNSLLNISTRIPPEILGHIFRWSVIPKKEFGGLRKGSYNFLLVCHYWFEVASSTPELWNFWGNTLEQWSQRYQRSGSIPLDLALNAPHHTRDGGTNAIPFDGPLRDALQDRAARDSIRSVHLQGRTDLLQPVISSLTLDSKGIRCSSIESLILVHQFPFLLPFSEVADPPSCNVCKNLRLGPPQVTSHVLNHSIARIQGDLERPNRISIAFDPPPTRIFKTFRYSRRWAGRRVPATSVMNPHFECHYIA